MMHTWADSLVFFALVDAATGSTDLVRVEGAMKSCFSSCYTRRVCQGFRVRVGTFLFTRMQYDCMEDLARI